MKIIGRRPNGAVLVSIGDGVGVILHDRYASRPFDLAVLSKLPGWQPTENTLDERRAAERQLLTSRLAELEHFDLDWKKFDEERAKAVRKLGPHSARLVSLPD